MRGLLGINCFFCYKHSDSIAKNYLRLRSPDPYTSGAGQERIETLEKQNVRSNSYRSGSGGSWGGGSYNSGGYSYGK